MSHDASSVIDGDGAEDAAEDGDCDEDKLTEKKRKKCVEYGEKNARQNFYSISCKKTVKNIADALDPSFSLCFCVWKRLVYKLKVFVMLVAWLSPYLRRRRCSRRFANVRAHELHPIVFGLRRVCAQSGLGIVVERNEPDLDGQLVTEKEEGKDEEDEGGGK